MTTAAERLLGSVRDLAPELVRRGSEIDEARRLPPDLVDTLREIGLYRMLVPEELGGLEIDYPASVDILTELSAGDGATGWTTMIGCETPQLVALLPRPTFDEFYADGPDTTIGGAFAPRGQAVVEDGGYRVSGRWGFASGCRHAEWLFGNCVVMRDGAPVMEESGAPRMRCAVLRADAWQIHDTWYTAGLRGTGSHDISIEGAFVPEAWTFDLFGGEPTVPGPLFQAPLLQFSMHIGAVALGIAEGAIRDLVDSVSGDRRRLYAKRDLADSPTFQDLLGRAEADARAARAALHAQAAEVWSQALAGKVDPGARTRVLQTDAWVAGTAARVVDACYTAGGGSALYESSPLQRRLRDIHALTQHASLQGDVFVTAGAERLGREGALVF
ncbi:MAG: acyl-CoA dehydrogenase family protein [Thermoanaerobaculia bacterium]|nr:acyl-CoA dehydrogenase family protein [Thermoanaerobaculia bacterium]